MTPRNCLSCVKCHLWPGTPAYSEYTPSEPMAFYCSAGVWSFGQTTGMCSNAKPIPNDEKRAMGMILDLALTCDDYTPEPWAKEPAP